MQHLLLPQGYALELGSSLDRSLLVKFMQRTYQELEPGGSFEHLARTVDRYLSRETPVWWVRFEPSAASPKQSPVACLWLGTAIDQLSGDRHTHVFLLYVDPAHRRKGIATALMQQTEVFARAKGDRQIGLQVFHSNQAALDLYANLGYRVQSLWMVKSLGR